MDEDLLKPSQIPFSVGEAQDVGLMKTWIRYLEKRVDDLAAEIAALKAR